MMVISGANKRIHYLSDSYVGSVHDYALLKAEFSPDKSWFKNKHVQVDLAYIGFVKDFVYESVSVPHKKPQGGELSEIQKAENKQISSQRITVEHSIAGLKRYGILSNRLRHRDVDWYNCVLGICAGLWNICLNC